MFFAPFVVEKKISLRTSAASAPLRSNVPFVIFVHFVVARESWRYRWPDDFRDEVLARLLELNRQYAEEECLSGAAAEKKGGKKASTTKRTKGTKKAQGEEEDAKQGNLF